MNNLASLVRTMQFFAHHSHNMIKGQTFFEDHEFLGDLYKSYEDIYDNIVERMIGLGQGFDVIKILNDSITLLSSKTLGNDYFAQLLAMEKSLCTAIEIYLVENKCSEGTKNLLADICDKSEVRQYKLWGRVN